MAKCPKCGGMLIVEWTYSWRGHEIRCLTDGCSFRENEGSAETSVEKAWWEECVRQWNAARKALEEDVAAALPDYPEVSGKE